MSVRRKILVDIGAHRGQTVKQFYDQIVDADGWKIFCFEPVEFEGLSRSTVSFRNVTVIPAAAGLTNGSINFYMCKKAHAQGHTSKIGKKTNSIEYGNKVAVKVINFVEWFKRTINHDDLVIVKMNIEGGEYDLMPVLPEILEDISGLYIKTHHHKFIGNQKHSMWRILKTFSEIVARSHTIFIAESSGKYDFIKMLSEITIKQNQTEVNEMITSKIFETHKGSVSNSRLTICEAHRGIYDLLVLNLQDKPEVLRRVLPLLEQAFSYGVNMTHKLIEYKLTSSAKIVKGLPAASEEARKLREERNRLTVVFNKLEKIKADLADGDKHT